MADKLQIPENYYRDCSLFMRSASFQYLMEVMKEAAIQEFTFADHDNPSTMQQANVKHRTIEEIEGAVKNAAKMWDDR